MCLWVCPPHLLLSSLWVGLWQHLVAAGEHTQTWPAPHTHTRISNQAQLSWPLLLWAISAPYRSQQNCNQPPSVHVQEKAARECMTFFLVAATAVSFPPSTLCMNNTGTTDASSTQRSMLRRRSWIFIKRKYSKKKKRLLFLFLLLPCALSIGRFVSLENGYVFAAALHGCFLPSFELYFFLAYKFVVLISWQISLSACTHRSINQSSSWVSLLTVRCTTLWATALAIKTQVHPEHPLLFDKKISMDTLPPVYVAERGSLPAPILINYIAELIVWSASRQKMCLEWLIIRLDKRDEILGVKWRS